MSKVSLCRAVSIAWLMIAVGPGLVAGQPTLDHLESIAGQLASPLARERAAGLAWLESHSDAAFEELSRLIQEGDRDQQIRAADTAMVLISPWACGIRRGEIHKGQIELFQPVRPTGRPMDHPHAERIRAATLATLYEFVGQSRMRVTGLEDEDELQGYSRWQDIELVRALSACLAEVADADAADDIAELLAGESNRHVGASLMDLLVTYHGLPRLYGELGICGNSTPEEVRQFELVATAHFDESRNHLLAWHHEHHGLSFAERIAAVLEAWDEQLGDKERFGYYTDSGQWATQTQFQAMIRLGEPAVPALRRRADEVPMVEFWHRGGFEIALAAISGEVDHAFVDRMLEGETFEKMLACEIIAAAGNREYLDQLAAMARSNGPFKKASYTLAVVYRMEAIPVLSKAWSEDYVATCAIAELNAWGE